MESKIFLSAKEAEQAGMAPWTTSSAQVNCDGCGHVIMEGDKVRLDDNGAPICTRCGEDG